jgi:serine/threonine-protein kinase PpkA
MNIPGYRIESELGRGGMSTVYTAVQESLQRTVALKVMAPALATDASFGERFLLEARTAASLNHHNILSIYDVGVSGHCYYFAMEKMPGGDLKQRLRDYRLTVAEVLEIVKQIASALGYAHEYGFVHRDVKPENILFRQHGTPVLADFGIAKAIDSGAQITGTGMSIGTPHYMSPEQAQGTARLDGRSDLYSLGIVLYEMLIGQVPFDAESTVGIALQHVQAAPPSLPPALAEYQPLFDRLLAKNPADRYSDAAELVQALELLQSGAALPQAQQPPLAPGVTTRQASPGSGLKWGLAGGLLALVVVGGFLLLAHGLSGKRQIRGGGASFSVAGPLSRPAAAGSGPSEPGQVVANIVELPLVQRARQLKSAKPEPWLNCTLAADPLPAGSLGILPLLISRLSQWDNVDFVDGYELGADGHFRIAIHPGSRYDDQGLRRTPYFEIYGRIEPGELKRAYGYIKLRQADSPQGRFQKEIEAIPALPFDLFFNGSRIVLGELSVAQGAISDFFTFQPASLTVENLWLSGAATELTKIHLVSEGFAANNRRDQLNMEPLDLTVSLDAEHPAKTFALNLDFGRYEYFENNKPEVAIAPGSLSLEVVPGLAYDRYSLEGHLDSKQFFLSEYATQTDWRDLAIDLSAKPYTPQTLEELSALLWSLFLRDSDLLADDRDLVRAEQKQALYRFVDLLANGLELSVDNASGVIAGQQLSVQGNVNWDSGVSAMIGAVDFSDDEFFGFGRFNFDFNGNEQAFRNLSFPEPIWPLLEEALNKQVLTIAPNGEMRFSLSGEGEQLYLQGHNLQDVLN